MPEIKLYNGDCVAAMEGMGDDSIDLILTDPPYNLGNFMKSRGTNWDRMRNNFFATAGWDNMEHGDWEKLMDDFFRLSAKVVKPGGAMILFMAVNWVESIIKLAQKHGFYYKTTGIWHKTNPLPRNKDLQFVNSTEAWIYFTYKTKTGVFNNGGRMLHDFVEMSVTHNSERRYGKHPTQKPEALMRYFVEILSNPDDWVLDPFMGSGTTGVAAKRAGRNFFGAELDKSYFEIAESRIKEQ